MSQQPKYGSLMNQDIVRNHEMNFARQSLTRKRSRFQTSKRWRFIRKNERYTYLQAGRYMKALKRLLRHKPVGAMNRKKRK